MKKYMAIIKNIPIGTRVVDDDFTIDFGKEAQKLIGQEIEVIKAEGLDHWFYYRKGAFDSVIFHRTWLENPK